MKFLFVSLLLSSLCFSQQFPFGVFANSGGPEFNRHENYPQMKEMGINYIIDVTREREAYEFSDIENVIGANGSQLDDYIYLYTKGMLMDWNNSNNSFNNSIPGFRYTSLATESGDYIVTPIPEYISDPPQDGLLQGVMLTGPYYFQYKKYKSNSGPYSDDSVVYHAELTVKIDGIPSGYDTVFTVKAHYNHSGTSYSCIDEIAYTAGELSNNDIVLSLPTYNLMNVPSFSSLNYSPLYNNNSTDNGIVFTINWKGTRKLYLKNLKIYDERIGYDLLYDTLVNLNVKSEVDRYSSINNLKYFYSFDEPHSIDNYKPYRIVDDIVKNYTSDSKRLITAIYPEWNGSRDNEITLPRFMSEADPKILFFWYYPFWDEPNPTLSNLGYKYLIDILNLHYDYGIRDFWIAPQAGGFWENKWTRREITANELLGQTMLSLAYGAKGIIYYQYYSQLNNDNTTYRVTGLVDVWDGSEFPVTEKYNKAKEIARRLESSLGQTLLQLNYQGEYSWLRKNQLDFNFLENHISFFNLLPSSNPNEVEQKHSGYLKDTIKGIDYILTTNLDSSLSKDIYFSVKNTNYRNYKNIGIKNIEVGFIGGFDGTYADSTKNFTLNNVSPSDGVLLRIAPMIKYGGELVVNETVSSIDTLRDNLFIPTGKTLSVNVNYFLRDTLKIYETNNLIISNNGYIILKDGGKVVVNTYGPLAKLKTTDKHPWFVWGKYTGTDIYYKILRRIAGGAWTQIDTTSNLQYIDNTITIYYETGITVNAEYKVIASKRNDPLSVVSDIISYPMRGGYEKEGNQAALKYEYNLEQNYPNPFNPQTTISYELKEDCFVSIKIYDLLGNQIKELVNENRPKGRYSINLDINNLNISSGIYFYTINAGKYINTKKMVILK